jgi:hypothetical protein
MTENQSGPRVRPPETVHTVTFLADEMPGRKSLAHFLDRLSMASGSPDSEQTAALLRHISGIRRTLGRSWGELFGTEIGCRR